METNIPFRCFEGERVVITGSTGFKGAWLSIWLHSLGAKVYGYALPPTHPNDHYLTCGVDKRIDQTYADICDYQTLKNYIKKIKPSCVFHLAAQALVMDSYHDPLTTFSTNAIGTANVLNACRDLESLRAIVIITSDKCYDNREFVWGYRENDRLGGKDPYSASKACAELVTNSMVESYYRHSSTCVATTRAGNVIGGGDWNDNRLIPDVFRTHLANNTLKIRYPHATRPWQHVLEPLSGYLSLAEKLSHPTEGKTYEGAWNFGPNSTRHYSVQEVVQELQKHLSIRYKSVSADASKHEAGYLKLDVSKATHELGWMPALDFEQTIQMTARAYLDINEQNGYQYSTQQIQEYTRLAAEQHIQWAVVE